MLNGKIEAIVNSLVNHFIYNSQAYDLFDFCSILLFRLTKAHAFHNGNKRTTIITISKIISFFGFYLSGTSRSEYVKYGENFMFGITSIPSKNEEKTVKEIKKILIEKCGLNLD